MILDFANTNMIGIGVSAYVATLLTVFLFLSARNEKALRLLAYSGLFFSFWSWLGLIYFFTDSLWLAREIRIFSLIAQVGAQIFVLRFVYAYLSQVRDATKVENKVYYFLQGSNLLILLTLLSDAFGTKFLIGNVNALPPESFAPEPGMFLPLFLLLWYALSFWYGYILTQKIINKKTESKAPDIILTVAMVGAFAMGGVGFWIWYDIAHSISFLRGLGFPLFGIAIFYAITNYKLFNIRIAAAVVFVFGIWGLIFLRILMQPSFAEAVPDIFILLTVIVLGVFLVRNVMNELATRIKLEKVSEQLRVLNQSLEDKVLKRTNELAAAKKHTENLVDYMPVGVIELDEKSNLLRINEVAEDIFGIKRKKVIGQNFSNISALTTIFGKNLSPEISEFQIKEPTVRYIETVTAELADLNGQVIVIRDITEQKELEKSKDEFISTAAHQLRTPLAAVKWTFELLEGETKSKKLLDILSQGKQGAINLEQIAEALMLSIRSQKGKRHGYTFTESNVLSVIQPIISIVLPLAEKKGVTLDTKLPESTPVMRLDSKQLGFAFQNLLDNAVRYTAEGGMVTCTINVSEDTVTIAVKDSGIGISKEDQKHLFEKFYRAKNATRMSADGSGLGLVITKSVVEAHDGKLTVESVEGEGSTFTISLPIKAS